MGSTSALKIVMHRSNDVPTREVRGNIVYTGDYRVVTYADNANDAANKIANLSPPNGYTYSALQA